MGVPGCYRMLTEIRKVPDENTIIKTLKKIIIDNHIFFTAIVV